VRDVDRTMLSARFLMLVCLLAASSCYALLGVEHNFTAADELRPGMCQDQCLAVLARGGTVWIQQDFRLEPACDRATKIANQAALAALGRSELESGLPVVRCVVIHRQWGFAGFGVFWLYLGERGRLLGYHLEHVN
jgi:hypothetical protein